MGAQILTKTDEEQAEYPVEDGFDSFWDFYFWRILFLLE
jgi:hypothetical protein